jgi:spectinomycin phosphotransferase
MLTPPDVAEADLADHLREAYRIEVARVVFLPLGADENTAVFRVEAGGGSRYWLKLRSGDFDGLAVELQRLMHEAGVEQIIPPIASLDGALWTRVRKYAAVLSPFVEGENGFARPLSDANWGELGRALRAIHMLKLPEALARRLRRVSYTSRWRNAARESLAQIGTRHDAASVAMDALLSQQHEVIAHLIDRAAQLAEIMRDRPASEHVLCHSDIHAGNVLVESDGRLHIVDWDDALLAPKERDLMFVGAGIGGGWNQPREAALFYEGYGNVPMDVVAIAYFRYERIVEDIAVYARSIHGARANEADARDAVRRRASAFAPGDVVEIARRADGLAE